MFRFRDKTVFILSPERWGTMKVSKHHYALELARQNCLVYFIEPPQLSTKGIEIKSCADHPRIQLVSYKPVFRAKRFLPAFVFRFLLYRQVQLLLKKINRRPDAVWCFQGYLFENLRWFKAPVNLFFAADQFYYSELPSEIYSADHSFAVSDTIYERMKKSGRSVYMIGHGVQQRFADMAERLLNREFSVPARKKITAGYVGNLRMEALDRETMMRVVEENPGVHFIFWGSYQSNDLNLGGVENSETDRFIRFLEEKCNVDLRGAVSGEMLQEQMEEADLFWLCWKIGVNSLWDGSNSHKLLEYLSTGKPVVAHHVSSYKDSDLLYMLPVKENSGYCDLFRQTVEVVRKGEGKSVILKRLKHAGMNSYRQKLILIEKLINTDN
ncbi:MAG: hypothetical protein QM725_15610 [Lacibacter sp.]